MESLPLTSGPTATTGFLHGASNFLLNNVTMIDRPNIINSISNERTVLQTLAQEMTQGADLDSSERYPPPRCHPGTRTSHTTRIAEWIDDDTREHSMFWLYGPAGVGKSAVAQSVAEHASNNGHLGAAFFFSRANGRNDYQRVWITIAYQLAVRVPGYQSLIATQLAADPDLLHRTPQTQFQRLIVGPISSLPHTSQSKFLVVLDGLDECRTDDAQINIIELISTLVHSNPTFPLLWMICSRPESHFNRFFDDDHFSSLCWVEELDIDSVQSVEDVSLFLRAGFREIQRKYSDCVDEFWPLETHISLILEKSSGLFAFATTILRYIDDPSYGDPSARLDEVITHLTSWSHISNLTTTPLDLLYTQILSTIPPHILPTTLLILRTSWTNIWTYPAIVLANLHQITRSRFYSALRKLHSVLDIPLPSPLPSPSHSSRAGDGNEEEVVTMPLRFMHTSFEDFLRDSGRCGRRFWMSEHDVAAKLLRSSFELALATKLGGNSSRNGRIADGKEIIDIDVPLSWTPSDAGATDSLKYKVMDFVSSSITWATHLDRYDEEVWRVLINFDYTALAAIQAIIDDNFNPARNWYFVDWLISTPDTPRDFVRSTPNCENDRILLDLLRSRIPDAIPLRLYPDPLPSPETTEYQSQHHQSLRASASLPVEVSSNTEYNPPKYFFLGYGTGSVLGLCQTEGTAVLASVDSFSV